MRETGRSTPWSWTSYCCALLSCWVSRPRNDEPRASSSVEQNHSPLLSSPWTTHWRSPMPGGAIKPSLLHQWGEQQDRGGAAAVCPSASPSKGTKKKASLGVGLFSSLPPTPLQLPCAITVQIAFSRNSSSNHFQPPGPIYSLIPGRTWLPWGTLCSWIPLSSSDGYRARAPPSL